MKQKWIVRRQTEQQVDGQRRWDVAYQCLLRWTRVTGREAVPIQGQQGVCDEGSNLCSSVDATASAGPDQRPTDRTATSSC